MRRCAVRPCPAMFASGGWMILLVRLNTAEREGRIIGHLGIRVAELAEIGRARTGIKITEDGVILVASFRLGNGALLVENIAEDDGVRRAHLLTRRFNGAVAHLDIRRSTGLSGTDLLLDL